MTRRHRRLRSTLAPLGVRWIARTPWNQKVDGTSETIRPGGTTGFPGTPASCNASISAGEWDHACGTIGSPGITTVAPGVNKEKDEPEKSSCTEE
jgi:hypothetical protein